MLMITTCNPYSTLTQQYLSYARALMILLTSFFFVSHFFFFESVKFPIHTLKESGKNSSFFRKKKATRRMRKTFWRDLLPTCNVRSDFIMLLLMLESSLFTSYHRYTQHSYHNMKVNIAQEFRVCWKNLKNTTNMFGGRMWIKKKYIEK
jgi:hypothetical protein